MLTLKQPVHYGYKTVHDLPTPPSTSRPSPPVTIQDPVQQKPLPSLPTTGSPATHSMSGTHRGLPPPAAMTLVQPPLPAGTSHPPAPGPPPLAQVQPPPPPPSHAQTLTSLPAPPQWQGSEDSMRHWLIAKTEEERRRQEEEKTRQETLRLEQRRLEHDMLRTSLDRGVPPPMVPVVFAGMAGGPLPQATLEWAQQYLMPQQGHAPQLLPAQAPPSPSQQRDPQPPYGSYAGASGVPSTPGSGTGHQAGFVSYQGPGSPTRGRASTITSMGGSTGRPLGSSGLPRLSTDSVANASGNPQQVHSIAQQSAGGQQETQSPSIYFHHWQPPSSQGSSALPATPSGDSPKKRKATGPQQPAPMPSTQMRYRSPPFGQPGGASSLSNPPPGRRRGHSRQRSDISSYRSSHRGRGDSFGPHSGLSPRMDVREGSVIESSQPPRHHHQHQSRSAGHSVSSLLSDHPSPQYGQEMRTQSGEPERRHSPSSSEEKARGGAMGSASTRERDDD